MQTLKDTSRSLIDTINAKQLEIYKDFLINASKIAVTPDAGKRYMTNIVKEALYNGEFLKTKHFSFESYVPVYSKDFILKCSDKKDERKIDPDLRFGLIIKDKEKEGEEERYYINITPTCNVHSITDGKILKIQIIQLDNISLQKNKNSVPQYIEYLQPYLSPDDCWEINYTNIQSISACDLFDSYEKVTLLIESVAKDLQHKLSSFYGRQGSIDFIE